MVVVVAFPLVLVVVVMKGFCGVLLQEVLPSQLLGLDLAVRVSAAPAAITAAVIRNMRGLPMGSAMMPPTPDGSAMLVVGAGVIGVVCTVHSD